MSKELRSAIRGSGLGMLIGFVFGIATLSTIGFDRMTFFEGLLLTSCAMFGGILFGSLIGVTGAFRKETGIKPAVIDRRYSCQRSLNARTSSDTAIQAHNTAVGKATALGQ
jgi:hypothetical protein